MTVHNHGTEDGPGLSCPEQWIDGKLRGRCMNAPAIPPEAIEAAARSFAGYTPEDEADDLEREINATCRSTARRILEAAIPHL
jgi:hypothetical protein